MKRTNNGLPSFKPMDVCMTIAEITYDKMLGEHKFSIHERYFVTVELLADNRWQMLTYRRNPSSDESNELLWINSVEMGEILDISDRRHGNPTWHIALMGKQKVEPRISLQLLEHVIAYAKKYREQIAVNIEYMERIAQGVHKANELKNKQ